MTGIECIRSLSRVRRSATFASRLVSTLVEGPASTPEYVTATLSKIEEELLIALASVKKLSQVPEEDPPG